MELNLRKILGWEKLGAIFCAIGMVLIIPASLALFALAHPQGAAELLRAILWMGVIILLIGGVLIGWTYHKKRQAQ